MHGTLAHSPLMLVRAPTGAFGLPALKLFSAVVLSLGTPILGLHIEFYDIEAYGSNSHGHSPLPMGTQAYDFGLFSTWSDFRQVWTGERVCA